jgi:hypothetical protein
MILPLTIPILRPATVLLALYSAVWISLEGNLPQTLVLGIGVTAVSLLHLLQRTLCGRRLFLPSWLAMAAAAGLALGAGSGLLTLFLMALKTGLHAHGPEFTASEVAWLWRQLPLWSLAALLSTIGLALILAAKHQTSDH